MKYVQIVMNEKKCMYVYANLIYKLLNIEMNLGYEG